MKIQFNTDKTISGEERNEKHFSAVIKDGLKHFESHLTRVEVHLSDVNGKKDGVNDKKCSMEARIEGRQPVAVTCQASRNDLAVTGAIDKMKNALKSVIGKMQEHH
jgi:hypothetical protein